MDERDAPLSCNGKPHEWEHRGGIGSRRCKVCCAFGYLPRVRTGYQSVPTDEQGVAIRRCSLRTTKGGVRTKCKGWAVGNDPLDAGHRRKAWRCAQHRTEFAVVESATGDDG